MRTIKIMKKANASKYTRVTSRKARHSKGIRLRIKLTNKNTSEEGMTNINTWDLKVSNTIEGQL